MTENPDETGFGAAAVSPVPSTGSGTSAAEAVGTYDGRVSPVPSTGSGTSAAPSSPAEPVDASDAAMSPVPSTGAGPAGAPGADDARPPVGRGRGARRARLMPAPGTSAEPAPADDPARGAGSRPAASGPNDARMLREVPPHY